MFEIEGMPKIQTCQREWRQKEMKRNIAQNGL